MKTKLLKKLRNIGRSQITIYSIHTLYGTNTGMTVGFNGDDYKNLFCIGDTEEDVLKKAELIYLNKNIELIRTRYRKYSILKHKS